MDTPFFECEEVFHGYLAFFGSIKEMLAKLRREILPFHLRHQLPKVIRASSSRSSLRFGWILRFLKTVGEFKERRSPPLIR